MNECIEKGIGINYCIIVSKLSSTITSTLKAKVIAATCTYISRPSTDPTHHLVHQCECCLHVRGCLFVGREVKWERRDRLGELSGVFWGAFTCLSGDGI